MCSVSIYYGIKFKWTETNKYTDIADTITEEYAKMMFNDPTDGKKDDDDFIVSEIVTTALYDYLDVYMKPQSAYNLTIKVDTFDNVVIGIPVGMISTKFNEFVELTGVNVNMMDIKIFEKIAKSLGVTCLPKNIVCITEKN